MASHEFMNMDCVCVICRVGALAKSGESDLVTVTERGLTSIQEYAGLRGDHELQKYLLNKPPLVRVHANCRKRFTNKRTYECEQKNKSASTSID